MQVSIPATMTMARAWSPARRLYRASGPVDDDKQTKTEHGQDLTDLSQHSAAARQLAVTPSLWSLAKDAGQMQAFIHCRLDYCNAVRQYSTVTVPSVSTKKSSRPIQHCLHL